MTLIKLEKNKEGTAYTINIGEDIVGTCEIGRERENYFYLKHVVIDKEFIEK